MFGNDFLKSKTCKRKFYQNKLYNAIPVGKVSFELTPRDKRLLGNEQTSCFPEELCRQQTYGRKIQLTSKERTNS